MRRRLEMEAAQIEAVLRSHRIPGRVWGGTVLPRVIRFELTTAMGTRVRQINNLAEEIAMALGVRSARVYRSGSKIHIEIPRERPGQVKLLSLCQRLKRVPPLTAVLGIDDAGVPLLLKIPSPDVVHVLIAGTSGSGKTALLRSILLSLALYNPQAQLQLVLLDPKGRGLAPLFDLPHLLFPPARDPEAVAEILNLLVEEMGRRDREQRSTPCIIVAVDELADLIEAGGALVASGIRRLAQRGREAGIHLVAATQKPTAAAVGSLAKANFPVRLVGAVTTPEEAKIATGLAGSGAEKLLGKGDFLLVSHGQTWRFQAAYIPTDQASEVVHRLYRGPFRSPQQALADMDKHRSLLRRTRDLFSREVARIDRDEVLR
ncbi:MAG TPA: DNA translocase FtsK [Caldilineae bacterium]|nr:DNA translocase FtsK [Caldilineae bacterium]